jgi:hypothetical protein
MRVTHAGGRPDIRRMHRRRPIDVEFATTQAIAAAVLVPLRAGTFVGAYRVSGALLLPAHILSFGRIFGDHALSAGFIPCRYRFLCSGCGVRTDRNEAFFAERVDYRTIGQVDRMGQEVCSICGRTAIGCQVMGCCATNVCEVHAYPELLSMKPGETKNWGGCYFVRFGEKD